MSEELCCGCCEVGPDQTGFFLRLVNADDESSSPSHENSLPLHLCQSCVCTQLCRCDVSPGPQLITVLYGNGYSLTSVFSLR